MSHTRLSAIAAQLWKTPFVKDVLTLQLGGIFVMGIGFVKSVVYARSLGLEGFGAYAVVGAFTGTLAVFTNFGQNQAAIVFFAESFEKKDIRAMERVVRYYLLLTSVAIAILIGAVVGAEAMASVLYGDTARAPAIRLALLAAAAGSFDSLFLIMLQSARKIRWMTMIENANLLLQLVCSGILVIMYRNAESIFLGLLISNVLILPCYIASYAKLRKEVALPGLLSACRGRESIFALVKQGLWIALDKNFGKLYPQGFLFIMSMFGSAASVGLASMAFKLGALPGSVFLPHVSRMATTILPTMKAKDASNLRKHCAKLIKHALAAQSALVFGSLFCLPAMLILLYGWEFADALEPMLWIALLQLLSPLKIANSPVFRMFYKAHVPAVWNLVALPIEFGLMITLLQWMNPLTAFVFIIALDGFASLWLSWYIYAVLLRKPVPTHA